MAAWVVVMVLLLGFILLAGRQTLGLWRGALIDERNMISLSRFQTVLWTVLVVSAFLVAALHNVRTGQNDPLAIIVPPQLWLLLGISVTSLVGSGLIKQVKESTSPDTAAADLHLRKAGRVAESQEVTDVGGRLVATTAPTTTTTTTTPPTGSADGAAGGGPEKPAPPPGAEPEPALDPAASRVVGLGVLAANERPSQSSWLDMFRTEEIGTIGRLALGKIQMFYFTIIIVVAYGAAIASLFVDDTDKITDFPAVDESAAALLGISHATYLAGKTVPRTPTQQPQPSP